MRLCSIALGTARLMCENIFGCEEGEQPSARQIAEYAKKIATYPNWDQVLEVFRQDAFSEND